MTFEILQHLEHDSKVNHFQTRTGLDTDFSAEGQGLDQPAGQIGHSYQRLATAATFLRSRVVQAQSREMVSATRYVTRVQ